MKLDKLNKFPWHSILFSLYPILALAAYNINEINIRVVFRSLTISLAITILMLFLLKTIYKSWQHAGYLSTLFLILFFSYGHIYNILHNVSIGNISIGRNRYLGILWLIIGVLCTWLISRLKKGEWWLLLTKTLNLIAALLLVFQLATLIWFGYKLKSINMRDIAIDLPELSSGGVDIDNSSPDIYYVILDAYGRSDVLQTTYGIDTTLFISQLQNLGFFVAECSMSNYAQTNISLASALNFNYLQSMGDTFTPGHDNDALSISLIKNSTTRYILEDQGYETVAFATGYQWTEWENADHYYSSQGFWKINEFENLLIRSSAGLLILDSGIFNIDQASIENVRGRTLYSLEKLASLPSDTTPKFVFAHLVIPHVPFVFGSNGEIEVIGPVFSERPYTWEEYKEGYGNQVKYINSRIVEIVETIITESKKPPIIILQGDHGPGYSSNQDRMSILNAYYLPAGTSMLYPGITPVNTFRVIFNEYFHGKIELLEDFSNFSRYNSPYEFEQILNNCPAQ